MHTEFDVVALGETLIDFAEYGKSEQGNTLLEACPGGAPCNVLAMLTKLGDKTSFIGKVGDDQFGRTLTDTMESAGIGTEGVITDKRYHTTLAFVHTFPDGDRDFSFYREKGADLMLEAEEVNEELIKSTRAFHFGTLSMTDEPAYTATCRALNLARENGRLISFDPNLREPLWSSLDKAREMMRLGFGYCDVLKISDNEIQFITGLEDYDEGVRRLQEEFHIPLIFLTMGRDGSWVYMGRDVRVEAPGYKVNTIETTGAGDTFTACALHGVLSTGIEHLTAEKLSDIMDFANAAAAIVTTRKGAIRAMPSREEIAELRADRD